MGPKKQPANNGAVAKTGTDPPVDCNESEVDRATDAVDTATGASGQTQNQNRNALGEEFTNIIRTIDEQNQTGGQTRPMSPQERQAIIHQQNLDRFAGQDHKIQMIGNDMQLMGTDIRKLETETRDIRNLLEQIAQKLDQRNDLERANLPTSGPPGLIRENRDGNGINGERRGAERNLNPEIEPFRPIATLNGAEGGQRRGHRLNREPILEAGDRFPRQNHHGEDNAWQGRGYEKDNDPKSAASVMQLSQTWSGHGSMSFQQWIKSVKNNLAFYPLMKPDWKKMIVFQKLTGEARAIAGDDLDPGLETNRAAVEASFDEYIKLLTAKIDPVQNIQLLRNEFEGRLQFADEPVDAFLVDKVALWERIYALPERSDDHKKAYLIENIIKSLVNEQLKMEMRKIWPYINPPNDYSQMRNHLMIQAGIIQDRLRNGEITGDQAVGTAVRHQQASYLTGKLENNEKKVQGVDVNSIDGISFVKGGYKPGSGGQSGKFRTPYKSSFKQGQRFVRLKNQNLSLKGKCFWCGSSDHFVRECPKKAAGHDKSVNGLETEAKYDQLGLTIDGEGFICAWVEEDEELDNSQSLDDSEQMVQAISPKGPNSKWKNTGRVKFQGNKNGYSVKRRSKIRKDNRIQTVLMISHYDGDNELLYEEILEEDPIEPPKVREEPEIQALDLEEIFSNSFSIGTLADCEEIDRQMLHEWELEKTPITEKECEDLADYF